MKTLHPAAGLTGLCGLFGISRQAYYNYVRRSTQKEFEHTIVLDMAHRIRKVHPRIGGRKLRQMISPEVEAQGIKLGRDALFSLF